jgi:hypothetical protein
LLGADSGAVTGAIVAAAIAALGYVANLAVQTWKEWRADRAGRHGQLLQLQALLTATQAAYDVQAELRNRLLRELEQSHGASTEFAAAEAEGYDSVFSQLYGSFTPHERESHAIIRGYTEHSLRPLNESVLTWLRANVNNRARLGRDTRAVTLAKGLRQLEVHVMLWLAKYEVWIPGQPEHALVYLQDEQRHGVGFPHGLDETLNSVIEQPPRRR